MTTSGAAVPTTQPRHRFLFVDGLRGIAAMSVVALHLLRGPVGDLWPAGGEVLEFGKLGVIVFFVISGFVISHSLGRSYMTPSVVGGFLLRRVARLDPPYWVSIILAQITVGLSSILLHNHALPLPSAPAIAAHLLYLQYILGIPSISDVYWTLCLEIQFYLLLSLLIAVKQRLERRLPEAASYALAFGPILAVSFLISVGALPSPRGSCFGPWFSFAAGVAAQRVVAGRGWAALIVSLTVALAIAGISHSAEGLVTAATAGGVALAARRRRLDRWLAGPVFQYLGRISYSLYLTHSLLGARGTNVLNHFVAASLWPRLGTALVGVAIAIVGSDVLWRLVERPSIELSHWVGTRLSVRRAILAGGEHGPATR